MKSYYIYILSNQTRTTFYIGVTNNLTRRMAEHRSESIKGFSSKYRLKHLLYYEEANDVNAAIAREKQLKNWHREWKINLIRRLNPDLKELDPETSSG